MIPKLGDFQTLSFSCAANTVYETVFIRNPSRPPSAEIAFERFRFSNPAKRHPPSRLDKFVETSQALLVACRLPPEIVFPCVI